LIALQCAVAFVSVGVVEQMLVPWQPVPMLGTSLGALAILLMCLPHSEVTKTSTVLLSHLLGAVCGVTFRLCVAPWSLFWAEVGAIALALFVLQVADLLHPPAGAVALWAVNHQVPEGAQMWALLTPALAAGTFLLSARGAKMAICKLFPRVTAQPGFWP